jgi:hypothetical protein
MTRGAKFGMVRVNYLIFIITLIGAVIAGALVVLSSMPGHVYVFGSTVLIPTFDNDSFDITGTRTVDYTNGTTLQVPYKNGTATIAIDEYMKCVTNSNERIKDSLDRAGSNILDYSERLAYLQSLGMEGCLIFNSANK